MGVFYFATSLILLAMGGSGWPSSPFGKRDVWLDEPVRADLPVYYLITRWDEMKRWFLTYLVGFLLFIPGLLFAVG